jgi:hypothetical protein
MRKAKGPSVPASRRPRPPRRRRAAARPRFRVGRDPPPRWRAAPGRAASANVPAPIVCHQPQARAPDAGAFAGSAGPPSRAAPHLCRPGRARRVQHLHRQHRAIGAGAWGRCGRVDRAAGVSVLDLLNVLDADKQAPLISKVSAKDLQTGFLPSGSRLWIFALGFSPFGFVPQDFSLGCFRR